MLPIKGAIRGTSKEKFYQDLGLESLEKRRWYWKLCYIYKIFDKKSSTYLLNIIIVSSRSYFTRYLENVSSFKVRHDSLKNVFFPSTVIEWNKIDKKIQESESLSIFKKAFKIFYGHLKTKLITAITLKKLNYYTFVNTSLSTVSRILLIRYAAAVKILKLHLLPSSLSRIFAWKKDPLVLFPISLILIMTS